MALTLHIANKRYSSWSMRPWVLMRTLNIPFEEKMHFFQSSPGLSQPHFRSFSPSAKVPTLHHEDLIVTDSLAIVEYLAEDYPGVWPRDRKARAFARSAAAEMHSGFAELRAQCNMNIALRINIGTPNAALQRDIDRVEQLWNQGLSTFGGPWLAGADFTAADAFWAPVALRLDRYGINVSGSAAGYMRRLLEQSAVVEWVEAGLREDARKEDYEFQSTNGDRTLVADLSK